MASSPGVGVTSLAAAPLLQGVHTGAASTSAGSPGRERPLGAQPGQGAGTDPSDAGHGPPEPAREGSAGSTGDGRCPADGAARLAPAGRPQLRGWGHTSGLNSAL